MCNECTKTLNSVSIGDYYTATRKKFRITTMVGDKIFIKNESGSQPFLHRRHLQLCLHWLMEGKSIEGVGGSGNSIRSLVGERGSLARCGVCERNVAYLWGVVASIPNIMRYDNSLKLRQNQ